MCARVAPGNFTMVPADINLVIGHKQAKQDKKKGGGVMDFQLPVFIALLIIIFFGLVMNRDEYMGVVDNCKKTDSYVSVRGVMTPVYDCSDVNFE